MCDEISTAKMYTCAMTHVCDMTHVCHMAQRRALFRLEVGARDYKDCKTCLWDSLLCRDTKGARCCVMSHT